MKLFILLFIIVAIFEINAIKNSIQYTFGTHFRSVKCSTDNYTVLLDRCYLKAYSRRIVTLNIVGTFGVPLRKPCYFQFVLFYRYGNIYREVIDTKKREWCAIMDGVQTHPYINLIISHLKNSAPKLFHKCPYEGQHNLYNITVNEDKAITVWPQGYYKMMITTYNLTKNLVFQMDLRFEVKSELKESMG